MKHTNREKTINTIVIFIFLALIIAMFSGCEKPASIKNYNFGIDTIGLTQKISDSVHKKDSIDFYYKYDSLKQVKSEINNNLFLTNQQINKIKVYIKIVERNPNNKEFFFGWIKRTVN